MPLREWNIYHQKTVAKKALRLCSGPSWLLISNVSGVYVLISISTPAGRSRFISESTVLAEGSSTSINRLWTRTSNCSRAFLWTWGERITVINDRSVGRGIGPTTTAPVRSAVSIILRADLSMIRASYALSLILILLLGSTFFFIANLILPQLF